MSEPDLVLGFPGLRSTQYEVTSPEDDGYNCVAWAAGDLTRWWWPHPDEYWPDDSQEVTVAAFVVVFGEFGYSVCDRADLETGWERVALYAKADKPTHMARQLSTGQWTSKVGEDHGISHSLNALEGESFGKVVVILKRPTS